MEECGKADRQHMTLRCVHIACWIAEATEPHSRFEKLIAFPQKQWLDECASVIRLYVHSLFCEVVKLIFISFSHISLLEELDLFFIFDQLTSYGIETEQGFPKTKYIFERKLL